MERKIDCFQGQKEQDYKSLDFGNIFIDKNIELKIETKIVSLRKCQTYAVCNKGLASYCKAETTFTFHFSISTLSTLF